MYHVYHEFDYNTNADSARYVSPCLVDSIKTVSDVSIGLGALVYIA